MVPLLQRLNPAEYQLIMNQTHRLDIKKGKKVYSEGDHATHLYFLRDGKIRIFKEVDNDKELTLFIREGQDCFGELGFFSGTKYADTAITIANSTIYSIEKDRLESLFQLHGNLGLQFTQWIAETLETSNAKMRDYIAFGSEGAIASIFIRYSNMYGIVTREGVKITEPIMLRDVSKHIGISRETVSRIVNKWKIKGIISNEQKIYLIKDMDYFRSLLGCERCAMVHCTL